MSAISQQSSQMPLMAIAVLLLLALAAQLASAPIVVNSYPALELPIPVSFLQQLASDLYVLLADIVRALANIFKTIVGR